MNELYFKVFRNLYLNNKIFSNLSNKETNRYKYDEIIDVEKMLRKRISKFKHYTNEKTISRNGFKELLRYKVKRGDLLKFKMIGDPIFQEYNDHQLDFEFYENLFLNYPQYYQCKTTMNNILKQDCSIALKVLFSSRKLVHLKYNETLDLDSDEWFITSIIIGSIGVANLLLDNNPAFQNLTNKQQETIWCNLIYERSKDTEKIKTIGSSIKFLTTVLKSALPSNIKNITLSYNIDGNCTLQFIYDICYCVASLFISLKPQQPMSSDDLIPSTMNKFFEIDQLDKIYQLELTKNELDCKLSDFDKKSCKPLIKELVLMAIWHGSYTFKFPNLKFFKTKFCGTSTNNDHVNQMVDCVKLCDFIQLKKLIVRDHNSKIEIYDNETPFQYCRNNHGQIVKFIKFSLNDISTNNQGNSNLKISIELLVELVLRFQDLPLVSLLLNEMKEKSIEFPIYKLDISNIIKWINGSKDIIGLFDLVYDRIKEKFSLVELMNQISFDKILNHSIKIILNHLKNNYNMDYKQFISKIQIGTPIKNDSFIFENSMDFKDLLPNGYQLISYENPIYNEISLPKFKYLYNDQTTIINDHQNNPKLFHWLLNNHPNDISTEPLESRFVFSLCIFDFDCYFNYNLENTILKIINSNGGGMLVDNITEIDINSLSLSTRKRLIYLTFVFVRSNRVDLFGYMWDHFSLIYQKDTIDHFCYFSIYHSNLEIIKFILSNVKQNGSMVDIKLPKIDKFDQFHQKYCLKYCIDNYINE